MNRRRILGGVLVVAGVGAFVLIWRTIAWMVYGGVRDYVQVAGLLISAGVAIGGASMSIRHRRVGAQVPAAPTPRARSAGERLRAGEISRK
ncbi:MAG TPA: hypothetical protein VGB85_03890 [Nannocystis sp.]